MDTNDCDWYRNDNKTQLHLCVVNDCEVRNGGRHGRHTDISKANTNAHRVGVNSNLTGIALVDWLNFITGSTVMDPVRCLQLENGLSLTSQ